VRFHAGGHDDPRDAPQGEVGFSYRFTWTRLATTNLNMPFSSEYAPADTPLPGGGTWHGGAIEWLTCAFDYTFFAAAVDEKHRIDGTPDSLPFYVGGAPAIDSVYAPRVLVLVPTCPPISPFDTLCSNPSFGPDTLGLVGTWVPDLVGSTPWFTGYNRFVLPFRAWGHDHPRDRNAPGREHYTDAQEGRIAAWKFDFDCVQPGCRNLELNGEHTWRDDPESIPPPHTQQMFDDSLVVTIPFDTLCLSVPCRDDSMALVLGTDRLGEYVFRIQGRDTYNGQICYDLTDLGPNPRESRRELGPLGRTTPIVSRPVTWVQLRDVRGTPKPWGATAMRRSSASPR
jgi:hypothetical protein